MKDTYDNPPPSIEERYSSAVGTSNLRVDGVRRTPADMVIAAGMSPHRLGMALRRLASEWDATGKPPPPSAQNIAAMASKYPRIPGTGLVELRGKQLTPISAAKREANDWHAHELGLLFQRLKTMPEVRAALVHWAGEKGVEDPIHIVGAVLQWWLHKTCPVCHGAKKRIIQGTGRTSSKDCQECKGTGEAKVPHGWAGRKMLGYMNESLRAASAGLRGKFRHQAPKSSTFTKG